MKTKGEVERDIVKVGIPHLAIYKPGLLLNRDNDNRIGEKIGSFVPFIPKIESADVGLCMLDKAIKSCLDKHQGPIELVSHAEQKTYAASLKPKI